MKKIIILLLLTFFAIELSAQTTNTSKWRKTERDSFENAFLLYEEGNHELAFPIYEACNKNHPNQPFIRYMYGKTALSRSDKHLEALEYLQEAYDGNKKIILIEYDLAKALHLNYKFDEALVKIDAFFKQKKNTPEEKTQGELLKKHILNAKALYSTPVETKVTNVGSPINTNEEEYSPVITIDESMFVYTYKGNKSKGGRMNAFGEASDGGIFTEDVYYSVKLNDTIREPKAADNINTNANDAAISLSPDGHTLFIYRDGGDDKGDIYKSDLIGEEFSIPVKLTGQVNSYHWDGHCSLTPDGKTLYFSSERPGGFGGRDIYRATLLADSTWGNVVNLGDSINTKYDEDSPFIHADGVTLFFSHNGEKSMGGYDVFRTRMETDSSYKSVSNLGYPINTPDNDIYFVLAANGKRGYYSSGKMGGQGLKDLYLLEGYFGAPKAITYLVKGKVTSKGNPYESKIKIERIAKDTLVFNVNKSNSVTGNFLSALPPGYKYRLTFSHDSFPAKVYEIDATVMEDYTEKILDVRFEIPKDTTPVVKNDSAGIVKDDFVTKNPKHTNTKNFAGKYGSISVDGLDFMVQVAAYKYPKNYTYKHLKGLGKIDKTFENNKITHITVGGKFKTLQEAWDLNKKAITAGQKDAFVIAVYQGKKVYLEELVKMGIFK